MKKLFLLLVLIFSTSMLFADFDIKLGVFKNVKNLRANIAKVKPYTFRKQIIVKKRKGFYYTYAIVEGSRSQAKKALKAYQNIFQDAFIAGQVKPRKKRVKKKVSVKKISQKKESVKKMPKQKVSSQKPLLKKAPKVIVLTKMPITKKTEEQNSSSSEINVNTIENNISIVSNEVLITKKSLGESKEDTTVKDVNQTEKNMTKIIVTQTEIVEKIVQIVDAKEVLFLKTIYLCYEDGPAHLIHRVVQMKFNEDSISYAPLDEKEILDIHYTIVENMISLSLFDIMMIHKVIEKKDTYLVVESYVGTKKMHKLRYYFNKENAQKFLK